MAENILKLFALMENPAVKSLRLASVNSILGDLNQQYEAVLTLNDTSLPRQQPGKVKVKIITQIKKLIFNGATKTEKNEKEAE